MSVKIHQNGFWEGVLPEDHTCCEELCNWIINYFSPEKEKIIYDLGCGVGQWAKRLSNAGYRVVGVEGAIPLIVEHSPIIKQDLTMPFSVPETGNCVFLEVAEHVPAKYEDVLLNNVANVCDNKLVMSWALRKQGGWGHVNELNNDEAIAKVQTKGFVFLPEETAAARKAIPQDTKTPWFLKTTLVFKRANV